MIKVGVSACLLGIECAYNGSSKKDDFVVSLSKYFEFIPFCPEDAILSHPRESMRLVLNKDGKIHAIGNKTKQDYTESILEFTDLAAKTAKEEEICGFIFAAKSPSCGVFNTKLYLENSMSSGKNAQGIFSKAFLEQFPMLPHEEEKRLNDPWLRYNFITRVYAYCDIKNLIKNPSKKGLIDFHTHYKFLLLSKSTKNYRKLGQIAAFTNKFFEETLYSYTALFLETIQIKSKRNNVYNSLEHMFGFIKDFLSSNEKTVFINALSDFKKGIIPLVAINRMFELYIEKYNIDYLKNQSFFNLCPKDLGLDSNTLTFK
jgi:uncharacterized protein YbgA (DUF1722 family)/uncharacterized protein YbbK (DUF523 family)